MQSLPRFPTIYMRASDTLKWVSAPNVTGDSKEAVTLSLLEKIIQNESPAETPKRAWILSTYAECYYTVCGNPPD